MLRTKAQSSIALADDGNVVYFAVMDASQPVRKRCVLIVEDDEDSRTLLDELVQISGHQTITAASAAEAISSWDRPQRPDLAFIDLSLPDADGFEVARRLRAQAGNAIRLVALTGFSDPNTRKAAKEAGFDGYVVKPLLTPTLDAFLME